MLAVQVNIDGAARRFCQQCCSFHVLSAFDGTRRYVNCSGDHTHTNTLCTSICCAAALPL